MLLIQNVPMHRLNHLLTALASLLLLGTLLHLRPEPRNASSVLDNVKERPVFEIEGLPLGDSFVRHSYLPADTDPLQWLTESLKARFQNILSSDVDDNTPRYPTCTLDLKRYTHIALESALPAS
jgi:hypothetical protein